MTVTLLERGRYYVVSAAATETHDLAWIEQHAPATARSRSRTSPTATACSRSRARARAELLQRLSDDDLSNESFPFFRARHISLGGTACSPCGSPTSASSGGSSTIRSSCSAPSTTCCTRPATALGLVDFGYRALESMRFEKCYRLWGADLSADWSPLQAGLERFVAFEKGDFLGRAALLREREEGVSHRLSCLVVDADGADAHGYEPVYVDRGKPIAYVSSGGYGPTVGKSIALAYLPVAHAAVGTELEIGILGSRRAAVVEEQPLYDPGNERLRS